MLKLLKIPHHPFTWAASFAGAYLGTFSHILLDGLMHPDMHPWWPFGTSNGLLGAVDLVWLHLGCVVAAFVGALGYALRAVRNRGQ